MRTPRQCARTLRSRFDRWIVHHVYPQRPFITFGSGATMTDVTIREHDGQITITAHDGTVIHNTNMYDTRIDARHANDGVFANSVLYLRRPLPGDTALTLPKLEMILGYNVRPLDRRSVAERIADAQHP